MSWSYSQDPTASDLDWVRWKVQDTDTNDHLVEDEEIEAEIAALGTKELAAVAVARVIARKFARLASGKSLGKKASQYADRAKQYAALAKQLEEEFGTGGAQARTGLTDLQYAW